MAFQDDLREYLARLATEGVEPPKSWFNPDLRVHRQHLLQELERLEQKGKRKSNSRLAYLHDVWSKDLERYAQELGTALVNGLAYQKPADEVTRLINIAISRELGLEATTGSFVKDRELERLSDAVRTKTAVSARNVEQYALEIRAVRRMGEKRQLTPLGRIALELPDRDVVRWLLTAEAIQSRGPDDFWRLSRASAAELHKQPHVFRSNDPDDPATFAAAYPTMARLQMMGVVEIEDVSDPETEEPLGDRCDVIPSAMPLLAELASGQDTPFSVLLTALLSDETNATLEPLRPSLPQTTTETAAAATTRHARMVAHEIRNALVPVQGALDKLYRDAERKGFEGQVSVHRNEIDHGIERVFRFIKEMMEVAERGAEPPEFFGIEPVVRAAIAAIEQDFPSIITFEATPNMPLVTGYRHRLTLAVINLLRNAAQAGTTGRTEIRINVTRSEDGREVFVVVEDNGPGVPVEHRSTIFRHGFSLRPGGTGQGLALVREVVESEMGGRAVCEESTLGGARFVLSLPAGRKAE